MHRPNFLTVVDDEDFTFKMEDAGLKVANLHCEVYRWSPRVLRKCYQAFAKGMNLLIRDGFKRVVTCTPNPKFAYMFGGVYVDSFLYEGAYYEIIEWELD